ncbi:MAG TPA: acyl-CoA dehydrogenase family protein, partial [Geobacteraceae bacterium]|nr:acyl-CoA dehydrogenase family protein [Geobacteraceae bacterium]
MNSNLAKGGEFLLTEAIGTTIFVPEEFTTEQKQIAETTEEFMKKEILPNVDRIEEKDFAFITEKLRQCADLGLFLAEVPEEYGGLELEKTTNMLMIEKVAPVASFVMAFGGHTGIGMLPLVYYGTADQKERYLGKLASGEWIGAYALTEPDCGSDPLSSRTTAVLSADGTHYILNGTKQFITNSSFAGLFTVFAKIDGKHFSAFLVEKGFE